jgi:hypothetical protein
MPMQHNTGTALTLLATLALVACAQDADRNAEGEVIASGNIDVFDTKIGDCFDDQSYVDEIDDVPGVPCSEPHDNEVYALFDTQLTAFPGEEEMFSGAFEIFPIVPTLESWKQLNDREIVCALYHIEREKLVGTMRGASI